MDSTTTAPVMLVLRDASRTEPLRSMIRRDGGRAVSLPAFRFETQHDSPEAIDFLKAPRRYHRLFFAGPNGVAALRQIAMRNRLPLPTSMCCAAPGQASRKALVAAGFTNIIAPQGVGDFDALLRSSSLGNLSGKRVALVQRSDAPTRGHDKLRRMRCMVALIRCYERVRNTVDFWDRLRPEVRRDINCIIAFDTPSLAVLAEEAGEDTERVKRMPLVVIHRNIEEKAREMGYENIIVTSPNQEMFPILRARIAGGADVES